MNTESHVALTVACGRCGETFLDGRPHACAGLRLVQLTADALGPLAGLDADGRVWRHVPGNGWTPIPMNVIEERKGP